MFANAAVQKVWETVQKRDGYAGAFCCSLYASNQDDDNKIVMSMSIKRFNSHWFFIQGIYFFGNPFLTF